MTSNSFRRLNPATKRCWIQAGFLLHISDTTGGRTFVEVLWRWGAESKWGSSTKEPIRGEWVHVFHWIGCQTKKGQGGRIPIDFLKGERQTTITTHLCYRFGDGLNCELKNGQAKDGWEIPPLMVPKNPMFAVATRRHKVPWVSSSFPRRHMFWTSPMGKLWLRVTGCWVKKKHKNSSMLGTVRWVWWTGPRWHVWQWVNANEAIITWSWLFLICFASFCWKQVPQHIQKHVACRHFLGSSRGVLKTPQTFRLRKDTWR